MIGVQVFHSKSLNPKTGGGGVVPLAYPLDQTDPRPHLENEILRSKTDLISMLLIIFLDIIKIIDYFLQSS